jgi:hypothetical protein
MKEFIIFYKEETILQHIGTTKTDEIKFGTMTETDAGEMIIELPSYPGTKFYVKEDK